jgi:hypothetical protein
MDEMRVRRQASAGRAVLATAVLACALGSAASPKAQTPPDYPVPPAPAAQPEPAPEPLLKRRALISRVSGRVLYRPSGTSRYRVLRNPRDLAFGAFVDARKGRVRVTVEKDRDGARSSAVFYSGKFELAEQSGTPAVTTLRLIGGDFEETCKPGATAARVPARDREKRVRRLWGDGKGRFRTRGRYSAATVRGTKWLTEDLCAGTLTRVARGEVEVEDFTVDDAPPARSPKPQTQTGGGETGTTDEGGGGTPPAAAPQQDTTTSRRRVRVRRGGSYVAGPK